MREGKGREGKGRCDESRRFVAARLGEAVVDRRGVESESRRGRSR